MKRILVLSDNLYLVEKFIAIYLSKGFSRNQITIAFSPQGSPLKEIKTFEGLIPVSLNVKVEFAKIIKNYDLVFSIHSKQVFPSELVQKVKCINIHPGLNPYNRGWYPQVFSILNKMPLGATIHEMDEELDHGAIICQKEVLVYGWDTSLSAYERVQQAEIELLQEWLPQLISGDYKTYKPQKEGNVNLKKDFNALCQLDLQQQQSVGGTIDLLRALSHGDYSNAFFIDSSTGKKVWVSISLNEE
ncbi:MAG: dTDP-4-amino-4,6-dideoxyglucose formyltransferase [Bacteroidota bacterium]